MSLDNGTVTAILQALESHAAASGYFERVNLHEPKSAPGSGITAALIPDLIRPVPTESGLASTTGLVVFILRIYQNMLAEPQDMIDPAIVAAVDALLVAYSGDFTLGGLIKKIDLLGSAGTPLSGRAGYIPIDKVLYRVFDITIPCVVNDLWTQSP